jgi:REP element-mobilizing transposase RayT
MMELPAESPRNRDRKGAARSAYLITFACYGTWLPGQAGAVDRVHNLFGSPLPEANPVEEAKARVRLRQPPYLLDGKRRQIVLGAIQEVCFHRDWTLLAAHVRTSHVHVVVDADRSAEQVMNDFKAYASRALNRMALDRAGRRRWAHHGSTRHLWTKAAVTAAVHYVVCEQGEPMAAWEMPDAR